MNSTGKMVRFGLLLALAVLLHYIESLFPLDSVMPGVKLGWTIKSVARCIA